ncbi:GtrA family protein [Polynucleobacter asymbioticus]|uniref:GtrA family protein n=1 Tax=Polynucleobacter asymbioticus TaxID=576611 RepID=UPI0008F945D6|nr:GtrA family protein [Polynucleobacter asymbioticus]
MIKRELIIFLIVGILTVAVDFATYSSLLWFECVGADLAKAIGFVTGTVFAYFANRFWTFGGRAHTSGSAARFILLYAFTLGANVWVNSILLKQFSLHSYAITLAFVFATAISAALNFLGMKFFVFKSPRSQEVA